MRPRFKKNFLNLLLSTALFFVLAVSTDHLLLPRLTDIDSPGGLLFPPEAEFPYRTPEYSHLARINSLGFRDRPWEISRSEETFRLLAIGDSFTFGMGVELEQSWPKVLERDLRERGMNVEIANLGSPGASPADYSKTAARAIPLLKPDMVLIAILQGDDLAQTIHQDSAREATKNNPLYNTLGRAGTALTAALFPNTTALLHKSAAEPPHFKSRACILEDIWKEQAAAMVRDLTDEKKARFAVMGKTVKDMFLQGHLNPGIVSIALADPHYFARTLHPDEPEVQRALRHLQASLEEIRSIDGNVRVIVISVPLGSYTSQAVLEGRREMGFVTRPEMLDTTVPDDLLRQICSQAHVPFISVTELFRDQAGTSPLYYPYDGHFNARGHAVFAGLLSRALRKQLIPAAPQKGASGVKMTDRFPEKGLAAAP